MAVPHHAEEGFVGLNNTTFNIQDEDPDDVGVDKASDLRLPFLQIAVQAGVLQRDRRLRRQQFQDRDPIRVNACEVSVFSR